MAAKNIQIRDELAPKGDAFQTASPADRRAYWTRVGELALTIKRNEIRLGIGADGKKLAAVLPSSRPDGATGKPLDPHYANSRTYRLLAMRPHENGVTLFWHAGISLKQKLPWATILGFHADGMVIGAHIRDTIGISPAGLRKLKAQAFQFWDGFSKKRKPPRKPDNSPPAAPAVVPVAPRPKPPVAPPIAAKPVATRQRADLSTKSTRIGQPRRSPVPAVRSPQVTYLKAGQKPRFPSRTIQVYED